MAFADGGSDVDGEFVLDEPGIYSEPVATTDLTGDPLPDVELLDADGNLVPLASFTGKPLVINLWYSTCAPCARELRDFAEVDAEHAGHIQFVGINPQDDAETMVEFAERRGVRYPLLLDSDLRFVGEVPVAAYPTTLFVSPEGRIVHQTNAIDADQLRAAIDDVF
jgi:peroxiredoxin